MWSGCVPETVPRNTLRFRRFVKRSTAGQIVRAPPIPRRPKRLMNGVYAGKVEAFWVKPLSDGSPVGFRGVRECVGVVSCD